MARIHTELLLLGQPVTPAECPHYRPQRVVQLVKLLLYSGQRTYRSLLQHQIQAYSYHTSCSFKVQQS